MPRAGINIGDRVTVKVREEAYYSRDGRPIQFFEPGMVGVVGAVEVPYVRHCTGNSTEFVCVDFVGTNGEKWRAGVDYKNVKKLPALETSEHYDYTIDRKTRTWFVYPCYNLPSRYTREEAQAICDQYNHNRSVVREVAHILPTDHGDLGTLTDVPMGERL